MSISTVNLAELPLACPADDVWAALPYTVYAQMLAFYRALALGISPDNPYPNGVVNRVVQGVSIHALGETSTS